MLDLRTPECSIIELIMELAFASPPPSSTSSDGSLISSTGERSGLRFCSLSFLFLFSLENLVIISPYFFNSLYIPHGRNGFLVGRDRLCTCRMVHLKMDGNIRRQFTRCTHRNWLEPVKRLRDNVMSATLLRILDLDLGSGYTIWNPEPRISKLCK